MTDTEIDILKFRMKLLKAETELKCYLYEHPELSYEDLHDIRCELSDCLGFLNDHWRIQYEKNE